MEPGLLRDLLTALVGLLAGVLSGAFGVGGATISTPGIRLLGVAPLMAVGTTLPAILPSAVSGGLRYRDEGLVDWRAVVWTVPVGVAASLAGAAAAGLVPGEGHVLQLLTAALLGLSAWRMVSKVGRPNAANVGADPDSEEPLTREPSPLGLGAVGLVAGGLSGLLGIGGGVVMVPAFNHIGLSVRTSVATSLVCVGALAVPGTIAHAALGNIDWRTALVLAVTVVPGARLGATASLRLRDRHLTQVVAAFLGVVALVYAAGELAAL